MRFHEWAHGHPGQLRPQTVGEIIREVYSESLMEQMLEPSPLLGLFKEGPRISPEKAEHLRAQRAEFRRHSVVECSLLGHVWGPVEREGGLCDYCDGEGLEQHDEYVSHWKDCSNCDGRGYVPTMYKRTCTRCKKQETKA